MKISDLVGTFPVLFHMAEVGSWESIEEHGLLSTEALLDLFEVEDGLRREILGSRRTSSHTIEHSRHGLAVIRDQRPLHESRLQACLTDMTFSEWLHMLNSRVFFWTTEERLTGLLEGRLYRDRAHEVLVIDCEGLVDEYEDRMFLCPINSGATIYNARPRGSDTFRLIKDYPFDERRRARGRRNAVVELAVDYGVPDVSKFVIRVERRKGAVVEDVIWQRS